MDGQIINDEVKYLVASATGYVPEGLVGNIFFERRIKKVYHIRNKSSYWMALGIYIFFGFQNRF